MINTKDVVFALRIMPKQSARDFLDAISCDCIIAIANNLEIENEDSLDVEPDSDDELNYLVERILEVVKL